MLQQNVLYMQCSTVTTVPIDYVKIYLRLTKYLVDSCNGSENLPKQQLFEEQSSELIVTSFHFNVSENEIYHKA
jgi:hypothetical protein